MKIRYLTGNTGTYIERENLRLNLNLGLMIQPGNYYHKRLNAYDIWAADNGCFNAKWSASHWWPWLLKVNRLAKSATSRCLFAVCPDVVGDAERTFERGITWLPRIRSHTSLPIAYVAQDGCELDLDALLPWSHFDVLFLGGSTAFKLDPQRAGKATGEALRRGIPVHMGRVNSKKRLEIADSWGCETADGTFLGFAPKTNIPRLAHWYKGGNHETKVLDRPHASLNPSPKVH